jgi:hypothetical protein
MDTAQKRKRVGQIFFAVESVLKAGMTDIAL